MPLGDLPQTMASCCWTASAMVPPVAARLTLQFILQCGPALKSKHVPTLEKDMETRRPLSLRSLVPTCCSHLLPGFSAWLLEAFPTHHGRSEDISDSSFVRAFVLPEVASKHGNTTCTAPAEEHGQNMAKLCAKNI